MLADIQTLENALPKAERTAKSGDKEAKLRVEVDPQVPGHLGDGRAAAQARRSTPMEAKAISSFGLMTAKPVLYVANVDENDLHGQGPLVQQVREFAAKVGALGRPRLRKLEAEIAELDEADRAEMLASSGLDRARARRPSPARPTACSACRATSPPARRRSAPGRSPSAPPPRKPPA